NLHALSPASAGSAVPAALPPAASFSERKLPATIPAARALLYSPRARAAARSGASRFRLPPRQGINRYAAQSAARRAGNGQGQVPVQFVLRVSQVRMLVNELRHAAPGLRAPVGPYLFEVTKKFGHFFRG